ncbi:hypothetical protein Hokovirus_4_71 [Hokovirus HKV1]|uniref:Uncharacterized protein n=1 Tax=Hokovirus HKV1 TaxID=1977638 RepID=A0A1V0SHB0_9VIRU|nr:hypothetical protein Hokovirus_4_71 [Hokovirus HKV1]
MNHIRTYNQIKKHTRIPVNNKLLKKFFEEKHTFQSIINKCEIYDIDSKIKHRLIIQSIRNGNNQHVKFIISKFGSWVLIHNNHQLVFELIKANDIESIYYIFEHHVINYKIIQDFLMFSAIYNKFIIFKFLYEFLINYNKVNSNTLLDIFCSCCNNGSYKIIEIIRNNKNLKITKDELIILMGFVTKFNHIKIIPTLWPYIVKYNLIAKLINQSIKDNFLKLITVFLDNKLLTLTNENIKVDNENIHLEKIITYSTFYNSYHILKFIVENYNHNINIQNNIENFINNNNYYNWTLNKKTFLIIKKYLDEDTIHKLYLYTLSNKYIIRRNDKYNSYTTAREHHFYILLKTFIPFININKIMQEIIITFQESINQDNICVFRHIFKLFKYHNLNATDLLNKLDITKILNGDSFNIIEYITIYYYDEKSLLPDSEEILFTIIEKYLLSNELKDKKNLVKYISFIKKEKLYIDLQQNNYELLIKIILNYDLNTLKRYILISKHLYNIIDRESLLNNKNMKNIDFKNDINMAKKMCLLNNSFNIFENTTYLNDAYDYMSNK